MNMNIKFDMDNDAFDNHMQEETERILNKISKQINQGITHDSILDINGNHIGRWEIENII